MRLAFIVLFVTVAAAHAEPPPSKVVSLTAGAGFALNQLDSQDLYDSNVSPSLRLDVAWHATPRLAFGIHSGIVLAHIVDLTRNDEDVSYYLAFELGATAQIELDRLWLAPWIGASKMSAPSLYTFGDDASLAYGFAAGYGVYTTSDRHYVDLFASAMRTSKGTTPFMSFTLGVDFRF